MSKMKEKLEEKVEPKDNTFEHEKYHGEVPDAECSACWTELHDHDCQDGPEDGCKTCMKFAGSGILLITED